jgi:iron complex outermembrane receptor protein
MFERRWIAAAASVSRQPWLWGLALAATPVLAQDEPADDQAAANDGARTPDIVVTAQFREQSLQDTPLAITCDQLRDARSAQPDRHQPDRQPGPSVTLKPQGAAFGPALGANIRGVGQFDFNPALEPGVGFYVDDVYSPR